MRPDEATLAALVRASTVMTAIVVRSLTGATPHITVMQARVLVIVGRLGSANVSAVAAGMGTNASNASRACDRLVNAGLITRQQADGDRRHVVLQLSPAGQSLIDSVMQHRWTELEQITARLTPHQQTQLRRGLESFNAAAESLDAGPDGLADEHLLRWMS